MDAQEEEEEEFGCLKRERKSYFRMQTVRFPNNTGLHETVSVCHKTRIDRRSKTESSHRVG